MLAPSFFLQPGGYAAEFCAFLVDYCETKPKRQAPVTGLESEQVNSDIRIVKEAFLDNNDKIWAWLADDLTRRMRMANRLWGFDVTWLPQIQYLVYEPGGHYDWHNDVIFDSAAEQRKISLSMQLSDPKDYEGGDLELKCWGFEPVQANLRQQGSLLFFPSWADHRVKPITKGIRRSLVAWFHGPRWR